MTSIHRSALVEYSDQQMFDLVNAIEHYPEFMPGCVSATVLSQSSTELIGELCLSKAGISQQFTTRNQLFRPQRIEMNLVEGPFKSFSSQWTFTALTDSACKVALEMEFEFTSGLMDFAMEKLFSSSANHQVDAIVQRAHEVYGNG